MDQHRHESRVRQGAAKVVGGYLIVGLVWIALSDWALLEVAQGAREVATLQTVKGGVFVLVTGLLLWFMVSALLRQHDRQEDELRGQRAILNAVVHSVDDLVLTLDLDLRVTGVFGPLLRTLELNEADVMGMGYQSVLGPQRSQMLRSAAAKALQGSISSVDWRLPAQHEPVDYRMRFVPLRESDGDIRGVLATVRDVTDVKRAQEERLLMSQTLRDLSRIDQLTQILNRRGLLDELDAALRSSDERREHGYFVLLDLDHFKIVNSTAGQDTGDMALIRVARVIHDEVDEEATVARLGADEFGIVLPETDGPGVKQLLKRIRGRLRSEESVQRYGMPLDFSCGIVQLCGDRNSGEIIGNAQAALLSAEDAGRGRFVFFDSDVHRSLPLAKARVWIPRLEQALEGEGFVPYLQPLVRLRNDKPHAWEVLLRHCDEEGTIGMPGDFLPVAERFGLMPRIDRWVLHWALEKLKRDPTLCLFVNLSALSLAEMKMLDILEERIRQAKLRPGQLTLEITETAAVQDVFIVRQWVHRLRGIGCSFALDDFGMGFSTFHYLRSIDVDFVKLDGSFVRGLDTDHEQRVIVQAITDTAIALGKEVIAEMVETPEVLDELRRIGVGWGQGWHWARPQPWDEVLAERDALAAASPPERVLR